jgi:hypothetical protein
VAKKKNKKKPVLFKKKKVSNSFGHADFVKVINFEIEKALQKYLLPIEQRVTVLIRAHSKCKSKYCCSYNSDGEKKADK